MSAALVIDIHSAAFWAWVDSAHPGSLAATIDGNGMAALHTAGPLYYAVAGKWITHPQGLRTNMQLTQVGDRREGLIAWHPDAYKARLGQAQAAEFGAANRDRRSPVTISKVDPLPPGPTVTVAEPAPAVAPAIPASAQVIDGVVSVTSDARTDLTITNGSVLQTPPPLTELEIIREALRAVLHRVEILINKG